MDEQQIQFYAIDIDGLPAPYPAAKAVPEWYKRMPSEVAREGGEPHRTIKQCSPFLDAMTSGYIIPLSGDIDFSMDAAGEFRYDSPNNDAVIESHDKPQLFGTPMADSLVLKFLNPWMIVTPPGYSTLFVAPLNQMALPFAFLAGVVATDTFYNQVHFPAVCTMQRGTRFTLKRGTPLMQVMPFKRENWQSELSVTDQPRVEEVRRRLIENHHMYRDEHHQKRTFK